MRGPRVATHSSEFTVPLFCSRGDLLPMKLPHFCSKTPEYTTITNSSPVDAELRSGWARSTLIDGFRCYFRT